MRRLTTPRKIISFNAKVGRSDKEFINSIRGLVQDNPETDVILLQEAQGYVQAARKTFSRQWRVYAKRGWEESAMCPVMVRKTIHPWRRRRGIGWGVIRSGGTWKGPKHGLIHPGRTWTWIKCGDTYIVSLHRLWGGDTERNEAAYMIEYQVLKTWINQRTAEGSKVCVFGDTNTPFPVNWPGDMKKLAHTTHSHLVHDLNEPGIDYALMYGVTGVIHRTKNYGSDHRAAVMARIRVTE